MLSTASSQSVIKMLKNSKPTKSHYAPLIASLHLESMISEPIHLIEYHPT